jgi:hypothetical protein
MRERVMGGRGGQLLAAALGVAMCLGVASRADAGPIAKDSFVTGAGNYADGTPLNDQGPADNATDRIGWSGDWSGATTYSVVGTGLDYGSVTYETGGAVSLNASGEASGTVKRSLLSYTPSTTSTYYFSAMMANGGGDYLMEAGDYTIIHFANSGGIDNSGLAFGFWGLSPSSGMDCAIRYLDGSSATSVPIGYVLQPEDLGETFYFVVKAEVNNDNSATLSVWLNPQDISTEQTATDSAWAALVGDDALEAGPSSFADDIGSVQIRMQNEAFNHAYTFDEICFGTTWAAVTGGGSSQLLGVISEPATLGLLGLALLGLRKRRS